MALTLQKSFWNMTQRASSRRRGQGRKHDEGHRDGRGAVVHFIQSRTGPGDQERGGRGGGRGERPLLGPPGQPSQLFFLKAL